METFDGDLTERALRRGRDAGLDAVGVTTAEPFERTRHILESRREAGLHGGMSFTYRNPARSTDPSRSVSGARSLVVGARSHQSGPPPPDDDPARPRARVARYATADNAAADHYAALRAALTEVADELRSAGFRAMVLADDNALVDRAAAHRAGLGWFGKNSNLLLPGRGSWFVLGSVVTDAALGPHAREVPDGCGSCRRCLDGCPTGAIVAPGVVDARRCLAWHLQMEGEFPREYRRSLGDRIYGCDDCQEVCPPNRRGGGDGEDGPPEQASVDVLGMLAASDDELLERHGRWYVPRRDPTYLRRNALVVLGNSGRSRPPGGSDQIDDVLDRHLRGPDELLAAHATWAALRLGRADLLDADGVAGRDAVERERRADMAAAAGPDEDGGG